MYNKSKNLITRYGNETGFLCFYKRTASSRAITEIIWFSPLINVPPPHDPPRVSHVISMWHMLLSRSWHLAWTDRTVFLLLTLLPTCQERRLVITLDLSIRSYSLSSSENVYLLLKWFLLQQLLSSTKKITKNLKTSSKILHPRQVGRDLSTWGLILTLWIIWVNTERRIEQLLFNKNKYKTLLRKEYFNFCTVFKWNNGLSNILFVSSVDSNKKSNA